MNVRTLTQWLEHRPRTRPITTAVIHATAGTGVAGTIQTLRDEKLSYHYIIDRDGDIVKCAPVLAMALHAGRSEGPEGEKVNRYSVGIALANRNDGLEAPRPAQMRSLESLLEELEAVIPTLRWVTTHAQISWPRKSDPRLLPRFATGLEAWHRDGVPEEFSIRLSTPAQKRPRPQTEQP